MQFSSKKQGRVVTPYDNQEKASTYKGLLVFCVIVAIVALGVVLYFAINQYNAGSVSNVKYIDNTK